MRESADSRETHGVDALARALQRTFPACECDDAPLARALLRLLSHGRPVSAAALAQATGRAEADVLQRVDSWPNVERDVAQQVVGFSGLTLRATPHAFTVDGRQLHTWCAWDTLFLPTLLQQTANIRSTCPVTGSPVELTVPPARVTRARPADLHVSFPPPARADTANITGSFCCHVFFLAGPAAGRTWHASRPEDVVLDLDAAYDLGRRAITALVAPASATATEGTH